MEVKTIDKVPENFDELNAMLTDQNAVYTVKGKDMLMIKSEYWVVYFNPTAAEYSRYGFSLPYETHIHLREYFNSFYGLINPSDFKYIQHIKNVPNNKIQAKIATMFENLEGTREAQSGGLQLGVELELERSWQLPFRWLTDRLRKRIGYLLDNVVNDGSVRGGTEIRFAHPKLEYWNKEKITSALKYLKNYGFNHSQGTAGMHIHMSGPTINDTQRAVRRFMDNLRQMQNILYPICARQAKVRGVEQLDKENRYGLGKNITRGFTTHHTLEIRVFEATLNPDVFYGRIKFSDYLMRFLMSDMPMSEFFTNMSLDDKLNYKFLLETENPHVFGCGKEKALAKLKLGA